MLRQPQNPGKVKYPKLNEFYFKKICILLFKPDKCLWGGNRFNLLRSISKDVPTEQLITATRNWERSRFYQCNSKDEYLITINEKISELKLRWQLHQQQRARSAGPPAPSAAVPTSIPSTSSKSFLSNTPYSTSTSSTL